MFADRASSIIAILVPPVLTLYSRHSVIIRVHPLQKVAFERAGALTPRDDARGV